MINAQKFVQYASIQGFMFVKPCKKNNKYYLPEAYYSPFLFLLVHLLFWLLILVSALLKSGACNLCCLFSCMWDSCVHVRTCACIPRPKHPHQKNEWKKHPTHSPLPTLEVFLLELIQGHDVSPLLWSKRNMPVLYWLLALVYVTKTEIFWYTLIV